MDTLQQLPTHGDGLLDIRELARTLLESMVNKVMDAQADMLCEDGANSRDGYRERGLATPVGDITLRHTQAEGRDLLPRGNNRALLARRPGGGGGRRGVVGQRRVDEEDGEDRPQGGNREALEGPGQRHVQIARRRGRRVGDARPGRNRGAVPVPRRHLRQVQEWRPRAVNGRLCFVK